VPTFRRKKYVNTTYLQTQTLVQLDIEFPICFRRVVGGFAVGVSIGHSDQAGVLP
jgi:hypothetical protein